MPGPIMGNSFSTLRIHDVLCHVKSDEKQVAPYKVYVGNKIKIAEPSVSYAGETTVANDTNVLSHSAISIVRRENNRRQRY